MSLSEQLVLRTQYAEDASDEWTYRSDSDVGPEVIDPIFDLFGLFDCWSA